tara:strand:- start:35 stop:511 length:477 start_codon:yes stop_codon:yes gene_type:complete
MKKLLVIVVLGLLWCNVGNSNTEDPLKKIFGKAKELKEKIKLKDTAENKKLTNFILSNKLTLDMEGVNLTYVFSEDKSYNVIQDNKKIENGSWKISGMFKNVIKLSSNENGIYYIQIYKNLEKISKKLKLSKKDDGQTDYSIINIDKNQNYKVTSEKK